ncbi:hypothetical protein DSOL_4009 [Desulfosporosinus metallidurans]|uniref:Uncharacterized protein n=1 Tax=Desulfosporosinus metallidurans TaxID=1888891 RepID=A0A1Q8QMC6_9FIRM|nr:hypothetical protein DSOL_4009 [Desulfosporosinus metallidurans]
MMAPFCGFFCIPKENLIPLIIKNTGKNTGTGTVFQIR